MRFIARLVLVALVICAYTTHATAQANSPDTQASAPAEGVKAAPAVIAFLKADAESGSEVASGCWVSGKKLPFGSVVVVVRRKTCNRYNQSGEHYEVMFGTDTYYTPVDALTALTGSLDDVAKMSEQTIEASMGNWRSQAKQYWLARADKSFGEIKAVAAQGVMVVSAGIFDISEHTEGTGFRITVLNTSKKPLKYITVNLVGLNAVKDPVRDRLRGSTVVSVRGIGPIAPDETASYSKDYVWMTDQVEYYTLKSFKLEYMDGSSRTVPFSDKLRMSRETASFIFDEK